MPEKTKRLSKSISVRYRFPDGRIEIVCYRWGLPFSIVVEKKEVDAAFKAIEEIKRELKGERK